LGLAKSRHEVGFRTTGTAAWPPQLCKFIARSLHDTFSCEVALPKGPEGLAAEVIEIVDEEVDVVEPVPQTPPRHPQIPAIATPPPPSRVKEKDTRAVEKIVVTTDFWVGGEGPPRTTFALGKPRQFHDGAGLTSPGRWEKSKRVFPQGQKWDALRSALEFEVVSEFGDRLKRIPFLFAAGPKEEVFSPQLLHKGRAILHNWLRAHGHHDVTETVAEGQPLLLDTLHHLLAEMRDPDAQICKTLEGGVTAGILHPLPRTPMVYEEQVSWRLRQDALHMVLLQAEN
jgi:hypothetical protein